MFFVRESNRQVEAQLPEGLFSPPTTADDLPMTSVWPNGPGGKALKIKIPFFDSTDTIGMTGLELQARRRMWEVLDYYQRREDKPWRFDHASPIIGLREGRRIVGDHTLTVNELSTGARFDDAIARGQFFLDGMRPDSEKRTYFLSPEEQRIPPYHIPLRSLIARDADNLLMAGRCLSADQLALSSARVMPTCAMMGTAAGVCAAMSVPHNGTVRTVKGAAVRDRITQLGGDFEV